jgi:hypothetical protein
MRGKITDVRRGTEGPPHDPYGYIEITVLLPIGLELIGHFGLIEWVKIHIPDQKGRSWERLKATEVAGQNTAHDYFIKNVGITPLEAETIYEEQRRTCSCGCKNLEDVDGHPGEILYICVACKSVVTYDFNEAAII